MRNTATGCNGRSNSEGAATERLGHTSVRMVDSVYVTLYEETSRAGRCDRQDGEEVRKRMTNSSNVRVEAIHSRLTSDSLMVAHRLRRVARCAG
jgi:hypothetical protein